MRWLRWTLIPLAALAGLVAIMVLVAFTIDLGFLKPAIESSVEKFTGRALVIDGDLHIELGASTRIELSDAHFRNPDWATDRDMISARRIEVFFRLGSLLNRPVVLEDVEIEGGRVNIEVGEGDLNNWTFRASASPDEDAARHPLPILLEKGHSRDFTFTYRNPYWLRPLSIEADELRAQLNENELLDTQASGTINGRPLRLHGSVGPFGNLIMATQVTVEAEGQFDTLTLNGGGFIDDFANPASPNVQLAIQGPSLVHVTDMLGYRSLGDGEIDVTAKLVEGDLGLTLDLRGRIGQFQVDAEGEASNLRDLDNLRLRADATGPNLGRFLRLFGIKHVPEEPYTFTTRLSRSDQALIIEKAGLRLGGAEFSLDGTATDFPSLANASFELRMQGNDIATFRDLLRVPGIASGPFQLDASIRRGDSGEARTTVTADTSLGHLEASGKVGTPPAFEGTQIDIRVDGKNLADIGEAFGLANVMAEPFTLQGALEVTGESIRLSRELVLESGDDRMVALGTLGFRPLQEGTDLTLAFSGNNAAELGRILDASRRVPSEPYSIKGRVRPSDAGIRLSDGAARIGAHQLTASGLVTTAGGAAGSSLDITAAGPDLSVPLSAAGVTTDMLPRAQYEVAGTLAVRDGSIELNKLAGTVGSSRLRFDGRVGTQANLVGTSIELAASGPRLEELLAGVENFKRLRGPFDMSGRLELEQSKGAIRNGKLKIGQLAGTFEGSSVWPVDFDNVLSAPGQLELDVSGPDFAAVLPENEYFLPDPTAFDLSARAAWQKEQLTIDTARLVIDGAQVSISGTLDQPPDWSATVMSVAMRADSLRKLGLVNGERLPDLRLQASTTLRGDQDQLVLEDLRAGIGKSDIDGRLSIALEEPPRLDIQLHSRLLDLREFSQPAADSDNETPEEQTPDKRLIPDRALPIERLSAANARFQIELEQLLAGTLAIDGAVMKGTLKDGALVIEEYRGLSEAGGLAGKLSVLPDDRGASVSWRVELDDFRLSLAEGPPGELALQPRFDGEIILNAEGRTTRQLASTLDGVVVINAGPGQVRNQRISRIYGDFVTEVFQTVNPFAKRDEFTQVDCVAIMIYAEDGILLTDPSLVAQTDKMNILAYGTVDLNTEKIDINFRTDARGTIGISAGDFINPYIKLGGMISQPRLALDTKSTLVTGAAAVATIGLSLIAKPLWDRAFRSKNPCGTVTRENEQLQRERAAAR